jgi:hypothetical protein
MFLSNPRIAAWTVCVFAVAAAACGSSQTHANKDVIGTLETRARFPFDVHEPDVYQAEAYLTGDVGEQRFFIARKDAAWRYDIYAGGKPELTYLKNDRVCVIDHAAKTWREEAKGPDPLMPTITSEGASRLFSGRDHPKFEVVSTDGSVTKYRATSDETPGDIFIYFDSTLGMITREEFPEANGSGQRVFELKNIQRDVEDSIFAVPSGYKKTGDAGGKK